MKCEPLTAEGRRVVQALKEKWSPLCKEGIVLWDDVGDMRTLFLRLSERRAIQVDFSPSGKITRVHATVYDESSTPRASQEAIIKLVEALADGAVSAVTFLDAARHSETLCAPAPHDVP